ncbi:hypothetical protein V6D92_21475, partial [Enterobacter hormaechei]
VNSGEKQRSPIYRVISKGVKINKQKAAHKLVAISKDVYPNLWAKMRNRGKKRALKMYYWVALGRSYYAITN